MTTVRRLLAFGALLASLGLVFLVTVPTAAQAQQRAIPDLCDPLFMPCGGVGALTVY
jgi:hypothetical protein